MSGREKVMIIGAGDHGRGVLEILLEAYRHDCQYQVLGFLDDSPQKRGTTVGGYCVLGGLDWIHAEHRPEIVYVIGIADPRSKQQIAQRLDDGSLTFISVIHPSVIMASGVRVAPGAIINAGVAIAYDTLIERHTTVNLNATLGHGCSVGRYCTIAPGANIAGGVHLSDGCEIGPNSTVARGVHVGAWSAIGPGSVVLRDVQPGVRMFGNPARVVDQGRPAPTARDTSPRV